MLYFSWNPRITIIWLCAISFCSSHYSKRLSLQFAITREWPYYSLKEETICFCSCSPKLSFFGRIFLFIFFFMTIFSKAYIFELLRCYEHFLEEINLCSLKNGASLEKFNTQNIRTMKLLTNWDQTYYYLRFKLTPYPHERL